jgi:hypothetical protein
LELNKNSFGGVMGELQMKTRSATNMGTSDPKFKNTAELVNIMQQQVVKMLKPTFGAQFTENEGKMLREIYGAAPKMSQEERSIAMGTIMRLVEEKTLEKQKTYENISSQIGQPTVSVNEPAPTPKPVIAQPQQRRKIRVRVKASGQTGTIEENEFDPNLYDKI